MSANGNRRRVMIGMLGFVAALALPGRGRAGPLTVKAGWDLLETQQGTSTQGLDFEGVKQGSFDFGGKIGRQKVRPADTILQRLADATANPGASATIDIKVVALQLVTRKMVDFMNNGNAFYYLTLQAAKPSTGKRTITFDAKATAQNQFGTFDQTLTLNYDIRKGGGGGPIVFSGTADLSAKDAPWSYKAPAGAILIDAVNNKLNGTNVLQDFWPGPPAVDSKQTNGLGALDDRVASVPEPGSLALAGAALVLLVPRRLRRRRSTT
jgi:hypothetical protein